MRRTSATRTDAAGTATKEATRASKEKGKGKEKEGYRETVEALVVAFILALLVRGFEAEAFVIPTGSMAPTLMGRHKEITCPQCGYVFSVNASEEDEGGRGLHLRKDEQHRWVVAGTCVNCRFQTKLADAPTFNGDRILVMKFPYDLPFLPGAGGPDRWDVVVFRYPEEPEVSYIKRLVGLPGEELRIYFGDVYIKPPGGKEFRLERKPLRHQRAMEMMVYDDRYRPEAFKGRPEWRRWAGQPDTAWKEESDGVFVATAAAGQEAELRYRHLVPDPEQWQAILSGDKLPRDPRPSLITDFYSYNSNVSESRPDLATSAFRDSEGVGAQPQWVGDLTVSFRLKVNAGGGSVRFELVEGGVVNRCTIDLTSGVATLTHGDKELAQKVTKINGPGTYDVIFANVDDRLTLLVDDQPLFGDGVTYDSPSTHPAPTASDLSPVGIVASGASVAVSDLVLKRDIYYTQNPGRSDYGGSWDHGYRPASELFAMLSDPSHFDELGKLEWKDFPIGPDRYMMLGDNSPRSKDSRGWSNGDRFDASFGSGWDTSDRAYYEVPRAMLTGKAFFVYWPHGKPFGPNIQINNFRIPFRPYFERMKWIR
ncbi:MAG: S26 family signal peptidase [Isosphaeraceae bacterium]|nr:S26 family signal peptidase [Isosphaeraceae bacterium]